jgi:hypothetical protein
MQSPYRLCIKVVHCLFIETEHWYDEIRCFPCGSKSAQILYIYELCDSCIIRTDSATDLNVLID